MVSYSHLICKKGMYVAIVSTTVETENPEGEIEAAVGLLGPVLEKFVTISDLYEPVEEKVGTNTNLWVTSSYDATSHFESASIALVEEDIKYAGYIERELLEIERLKELDDIRLPRSLIIGQPAGFRARFATNLRKFGLPHSVKQAGFKE